MALLNMFLVVLFMLGCTLQQGCLAKSPSQSCSMQALLAQLVLCVVVWPSRQSCIAAAAASTAHQFSGSRVLLMTYCLTVSALIRPRVLAERNVCQGLAASWCQDAGSGLLSVFSMRIACSTLCCCM